MTSLTDSGPTSLAKTRAPIPPLFDPARALDAPAGRSLWDDARRRLFRNRAAVTAMILLALIAAFCFLGPLFAPSPVTQNYALEPLPFPPGNGQAYSNEYGEEKFYHASDPRLVRDASGAVSLIEYEGADPLPLTPLPTLADGTPGRVTYVMGSDDLGRDLMARLMQGGQVSLQVGIVATLVAALIGVLYGAVAGFVGGRVDELMMRFVDTLYALPFIFIVIVLVTIFERNFGLIFVAIGMVEWLTMARIVRAQTIALRRREFIEAAEAAGVPWFTIVLRHIVPNVLGAVIVYTTLLVPAVILVESFISFLGLGVQEPNTSWGTMISQGREHMERAPHTLLVPALAMSLTLLCLNFIGDGLRDALDPKDR